jgi:hypothetical protein
LGVAFWSGPVRVRPHDEQKRRRAVESGRPEACTSAHAQPLFFFFFSLLSNCMQPSYLDRGNVHPSPRSCPLSLWPLLLILIMFRYRWRGLDLDKGIPAYHRRPQYGASPEVVSAVAVPSPQQHQDRGGDPIPVMVWLGRSGVSTVRPGHTRPRPGLVCETQSTLVHGPRANGLFWSRPGLDWVGRWVG